MKSGGLRRKLGAAQKNQAAAGTRGAAVCWKLALARAARDEIGLDLSVSELRQSHLSLAELLELPPERAMILILDGPHDGIGLLVFSAEVLAALIEMQTIGRVTPALPPPRRPTRTDAAMVAGLADAALAGLEGLLDGDDDRAWAGQFRYGSFLEDARPLGLLLEDVGYRALRAEVSLAAGTRSGLVLLALPASGKAQKPVSPNLSATANSLVFKAAMTEQVLTTNATLNAVLARVTLPLQAILNFSPGDPLPLGQAILDQIDIEGVDGCRLAGGKLGQNRGMRAIRLSEKAAPAARHRLKRHSPADESQVEENPVRAAG